MNILKKDGFIPYETPNFTFGFEIEGFFHKDILKDLKKGGIFKSDGSVRSSGLNIESDNLVEQTDGRPDRHDYATEYNSPVFNSIDKLIEQLKLFSGDRYYSNNSCGVHLHIGYKNKYALANKFKTQAIIEQLQNRFLPLVCKCVKDRINAQQWCNLHASFYQGRVASYDKYKAVNFHSQGTIELRLFAPCKHLIGDIQKVLTEFFRVGYRDFATEPDIVQILSKEKTKLAITETISLEKINFNYGFDKIGVYPISLMARMADKLEMYHLRNSLSHVPNYGSLTNYITKTTHLNDL